MAHYLAELYSPKPAWLALDQTSRRQFFKAIGAGMGALSALGGGSDLPGRDRCRDPACAVAVVLPNLARNRRGSHERLGLGHRRFRMA